MVPYSSDDNRAHLLPGSSDNNRAPNQHIAEVDDSEYSTDNGNASDSWPINSRIANLSGADYERISSQQALKRTLPPSLLPSAPSLQKQTSTPSSRSKNLVENMGSSQFHDAYGNSYYSAGPSVSNSKGDLRDQFSRGKDDDVFIYDNSYDLLKQPSAPSSRSNNFVENMGSSQVRDAYGNSYHSAGPSVSNSKGDHRDQFSRGKNDDVFIYESNVPKQPFAPSSRINNLVENIGSSQVRDAYGNSYHSAGPSVSNSGSRILPPSFMHAKAISSNPLAITSDPLYRSMVGEERNAGSDERLIYQAALEVPATIYHHVIQFKFD